MNAQQILTEIAGYCREAGLAESTFGRLAVNDGKLIARLRDGGRITSETLDRIRTYIAANPAVPRQMGEIIINESSRRLPHKTNSTSNEVSNSAGKIGNDAQRNFRFFDNRQKYLLFVNTCSEKWVIAERIALELANIHPHPPALRVFDAGVGDGTVLARVLRAIHAKFPTMPLYVVGKEISVEDIRLTLEKLPDRFFEHPGMVVVLTNLYYSEAPWLTVKTLPAANSLVWHEVPLGGKSAYEFETQITALQPFLSESWKARISKNSGSPIYERPVVLVMYREDHKFLLNAVIPRRGHVHADYDLVIASQPYRARASAQFKARCVIGPLARSLGPGGRLIGIHSCGNDPGLEIIQRVWPGDNPFEVDRHQLLKGVKLELGSAAGRLNFNAYADSRSIFRYEMHTLPDEVEGSIGTSTLFAAWNAAIYVAQVEDDRLSIVVNDGRYLDATREVLQKHGGLWFKDESFIISRRRD